MAVKFSLADKLAARNPQKALARARELAAQGEHERAFPLFATAAEAGLPEAARALGFYYLNGAATGFRSAKDAARWLLLAAQAGDTKAQAELGNLYAHGLYRDDHSQALFAPQDQGAETPEQTAPDLQAALKWLTLAAEAGEANAQTQLGYLYSRGPAEVQNIEQAKHWYGRAAAAGLPHGHLGLGTILLLEADDDEKTFAAVAHIRKAAEADLATGHFYLGLIHERAIGVHADLEQAARHYKLAAEKGIRDAQHRYGIMLYQGQVIAQNKVEGETWLRRAALAGDAEAAMRVGEIYAKGDDGFPPNYAEAANWFRVAAEGGHRGAARTLGLLNLTGIGAVPRNPDEAAKWLRLAAEQGDQRAQTDLAAMVVKRQVNPRVAEIPPVQDWFAKAAESGDPIGAYNFAVCLAEGVGVARDDAAAAHWFRKAADNVVNAQYRYGRILAEGRGVEQNLEEARLWLQKAADLNLLPALLDLAMLHLQGLGGPRDDEAARVLFERASEQESAEAMFSLGALYGGGHQIETDRAKSLAWYRQAAQRQHPRAALMLGLYLRDGIATAPDLEAARRCFTFAAEAGLDEAKDALAGLPPAAAAE